MGKGALAKAGISGIESLIGGGGGGNQVQAFLDPQLLKFLQNQGTLQAKFQGSQSGTGGSTMTAGRQGFNQYGALLSANQTANQIAQTNVAAAGQQQQASNLANQIAIGNYSQGVSNASRAGSAAGTATGTGNPTPDVGTG